MKTNNVLDAQSENEIPLVLTVDDIARILGVGKNTAYSLVNDGVLHSIRVGRQIRISRAEFCRYLGIGDIA